MNSLKFLQISLSAIKNLSTLKTCLPMLDYYELFIVNVETLYMYAHLKNKIQRNRDRNEIHGQGKLLCVLLYKAFRCFSA